MRTRVETLTQKKSSWKRQASCALLRQDRYVARQDRDVRLVMLDVSHPHAISAPIMGPSDFDILLDSFLSLLFVLDNGSFLCCLAKPCAAAI